MCNYFLKRRCAPSSVPPNQSLVANGAVKSCCCRLGKCSGVALPREPWHDAVDEEDFPSVNSVLVENENCDTKVGFLKFVVSFLMFLSLIFFLAFGFSIV